VIEHRVRRRSVSQFAKIVHHHIRAMAPKLLGISLAGDADHESELAATPGVDSRDGVLDDDRARRLNLKQLGGDQKGIGGGFGRWCWALMTLPSTRASKKASSLAAFRTAVQF
jgi:hypothetical protein